MCIIAMKSQTAAERGRRAALAENVRAGIVSIDPSVTRHGCSVGISVPCSEVERLKRILTARGIRYGDVIGGWS